MTKINYTKQYLVSISIQSWNAKCFPKLLTFRHQFRTLEITLSLRFRVSIWPQHPNISFLNYTSHTRVGSPKNLFIISDALPAVPGRALDNVAQSIYQEPSQQFLKGALMPFLGFSPWLQKLVSEDRIECYGWPIGITAYWFREISSEDRGS